MDPIIINTNNRIGRTTRDTNTCIIMGPGNDITRHKLMVCNRNRIVTGIYASGGSYCLTLSCTLESMFSNCNRSCLTICHCDEDLPRLVHGYSNCIITGKLFVNRCLHRRYKLSFGNFVAAFNTHVAESLSHIKVTDDSINGQLNLCSLVSDVVSRRPGRNITDGVGGRPERSDLLTGSRLCLCGRSKFHRNNSINCLCRCRWGWCRQRDRLAHAADVHVERKILVIRWYRTHTLDFQRRPSSDKDSIFSIV